ncbi:uncharacterized protein LOC122460704 [Dermochelys coriacea]|uniref:uncharacterized protein LOC122460704 n=1 Tax=Dermochelys coriacea TaxID=27794 RepID=UPI001CA957E0|nr:uncharacterized protein LOC122460704 [Dermochelys coriacea]
MPLQLHSRGPEGLHPDPSRSTGREAAPGTPRGSAHVREVQPERQGGAGQGPATAARLRLSSEAGPQGGAAGTQGGTGQPLRRGRGSRLTGGRLQPALLLARVGGRGSRMHRAPARLSARPRRVNPPPPRERRLLPPLQRPRAAGRAPLQPPSPEQGRLRLGCGPCPQARSGALSAPTPWRTANRGWLSGGLPRAPSARAGGGR